LSRFALGRWLPPLAIAVLVIGAPLAFYRWAYVHGKRFREVTPGRVYRSGQMTADGFREEIRRHGIRTVINLQDEYADPDVLTSWLGGGTIRETELCAELGVRYVFLPPNLISRRKVPPERPEAIDRFLALLDDPETYPVLLHCRAGLHRTGVMVAVYRMEYEGWGPRAALDELRANGFGEWPCSPANDYIMQYILTYQRGRRQAEAAGGLPATPVPGGEACP
jgi:protein tyrosine phosphatase (PTP) superfamily phosphohydrolase (DUF442 family)